MEELLLHIQTLFNIPAWGLAVVGILVFVAGYVDAIAGGGGLISLPAYLIAGLPTHTAIATNKLSSAMGTAVSTWHYAKSGFIHLSLAIPAILCAFIGSGAGSNLVLLVDDFVLKILLLAILPLTAVYVMRSKQLTNDVSSSYSRKIITLISCLIALVIGAYDGFYGPGTGTFLILTLTGIAQLRLDAAAGLTKAINLSTNVASLVVFLLHGEVLILLGLVAGIFGILGNYLGSHQFTSKGAGVAKPITITVLIIFFGKVIYDLLLETGIL